MNNGDNKIIITITKVKTSYQNNLTIKLTKLIHQYNKTLLFEQK